MPVPSIEQLEQRLLAQLQSNRLKVAMIIMRATNNLHDFENMEEEAVNDLMDTALARVAARKDVCSYGDIKNWRHSEMHIVEGINADSR